MGLTSSSTGNLLISHSNNIIHEKTDYIIGLAGNPNVR